MSSITGGWAAAAADAAEDSSDRVSTVAADANETGSKSGLKAFGADDDDDDDDEEEEEEEDEECR